MVSLGYARSHSYLASIRLIDGPCARGPPPKFWQQASGEHLGCRLHCTTPWQYRIRLTAEILSVSETMWSAEYRFAHIPELTAGNICDSLLACWSISLSCWRLLTAAAPSMRMMRTQRCKDLCSWSKNMWMPQRGQLSAACDKESFLIKHRIYHSRRSRRWM